MKRIYLDKDKLIELYCDKGYSQKKVAEILGCSVDTVARNIKEYNIKTHKCGSWMCHHNACLNQRDLEILNGAMLGDGCYIKGKMSVNAQFAYLSKSEQHVQYVCSRFSKYSYKEGIKKSYYNDKRTGKTYSRYSFRTVSDVGFTEEYNRWYIDGIKHIPKDLVLTPLTCLIWYLGDGGLINGKRSQEIKLATNCFDKDEINNILLPQLSQFNARLVKTGISKNNNVQYCVYIPHISTKEFLDFIGDCPFKDYEYKWKFKEYKNFSIKTNKSFMDTILNLFNDGYSAGTIAKFQNVDRSTVVKYLKLNGIDPSINAYRKGNKNMAKRTMENCVLTRKTGQMPREDGNTGKCLGFGTSECDDEPCDTCKKCKLHTHYGEE